MDRVRRHRRAADAAAGPGARKCAKSTACATGWRDNALTAIITAKIDGAHVRAPCTTASCSSWSIAWCASSGAWRTASPLRKHRRSRSTAARAIAAGEFPLSFGPSGIEVGAAEPAEIAHEASSERVTAGFKRLDAMLGGGVFRGSSTLITGVPGTSKTTLAGKFAEAACRRGERTLFVSFDEGAEQIARNLTSVGIQLKPHVKSGLLRMYSARTEGISAEEHLITAQVADPRAPAALHGDRPALGNRQGGRARRSARRGQPAHLHDQGCRTSPCSSPR